FVAIEKASVQVGRRANFNPGSPQTVAINVAILREDGRWKYPWLVVVADYYGPHGAHVTQSYDWDGGVRWRLRRLVIDPDDGGKRIAVEMGLGRNYLPDSINPQVDTAAALGPTR